MLCVAVSTATVTSETLAANAPHSDAWRLVNAENIEVVWRVRSLLFFADDSCSSSPLLAIPGQTGEPFATEAAEMTGPEYVYNLRSPRGWESAGPCEIGECHVGFIWANATSSPVRCLVLNQGETSLHAEAVTLQHRSLKDSVTWEDVVTWRDVETGGRVKLALSCPSVPSLARGRVENCVKEDERHQTCEAHCDAGYGAMEQHIRCIHGAWYLPECMPINSMMRIAAQEPQHIKPYWVVLDVALYAKEDCTDVLVMDGSPISSGDFVIKYASYAAKNAWDGDSQTSWASSFECDPGACYIGFRFHSPPSVGSIKCARVVHPEGRTYQATEVSVETLGERGWEPMRDVAIQLLPKAKDEL